jgi:hypothetical protein
MVITLLFPAQPSDDELLTRLEPALANCRRRT